MLISIILVVTNLLKVSELVSLSSACPVLLVVLQLFRAHPNSSFLRVCLLQISPHPEGLGNDGNEGLCDGPISEPNRPGHAWRDIYLTLWRSWYSSQEADGLSGACKSHLNDLNFIISSLCWTGSPSLPLLCCPSCSNLLWILYYLFEPLFLKITLFMGEEIQ